MEKQIYFDCLNIENMEMTLILKSGEKIDVPNIYVATSLIHGIYKNKVEKLEAKTIYSIVED